MAGSGANMHRVPVLPSFRWAFAVGLLLLPCAPATGASSLVVQQIGDPTGQIAEAVAAEVMVVPLSPDLDPRSTSIILASGKIFVGRDGEGVGGLRPGERRALQQAYDAGQVTLLLDASTHDIEALHVLLEDGVAHESSTDPVVLAYALRQENNIATARVVTHPVEDDFGEDLDEDELEEDELALSRALEIVIEELTQPPAAPEDDDAASSTNWGDSPVQKTILTKTHWGTYNTPVEVYALHSCQENRDYYLVNTGGSWTAESAQFESAARKAGNLILSGPPRDPVVVAKPWQLGREHCTGGIDIFKGIFPFQLDGDDRLCRYRNYPLYYQVDIVPPSGPTVVQVNAAPAGDQGKSASYTSGFSWSIFGGVEVAGKGRPPAFRPAWSGTTRSRRRSPHWRLKPATRVTKGRLRDISIARRARAFRIVRPPSRWSAWEGHAGGSSSATRNRVRRRMAACPTSLRRSIGWSTPRPTPAARLISR